MNRCLIFGCFIFSIASEHILAGDDGRMGFINQGLEVYGAAQSLTERDARIASFAHAEQLFNQAALGADTNADLYANAGTAALQAERLGPAVLAFRRALAVDPDHARSRRNLAHARALLPAWVPRFGAESVLDTFFFWHRSLSKAERAGAGAVCFLLASLAFAVAIRWPGRSARSLGVVLAVVWVALIASVVVDVRGSAGADAVIIAEDTLARASDSANAPARFADPLPGGTEVNVIETRDRWARVRLANDREAWVSHGSLDRVSGPDGRSAD